MISRDASRPASSGTGWAASRTWMRDVGTAWPYRVTTSPERSPVQCCSTARAIEAAALPAPMTMVRPAAASGRFGGTH